MVHSSNVHQRETRISRTSYGQILTTWGNVHDSGGADYLLPKLAVISVSFEENIFITCCRCDHPFRIIIRYVIIASAICYISGFSLFPIYVSRILSSCSTVKVANIVVSMWAVKAGRLDECHPDSRVKNVKGGWVEKLYETDMLARRWLV